MLREDTLAKWNEPYQQVLVESYEPAVRTGLHGPIHVRPCEGQGYPVDLHVSCSSDLKDRQRHEVGTKFRIQAKLTDRKGGGEYLFSDYRWPYVVVSKP